MAKKKPIDTTLVRPNDPVQIKLLTTVKARMKEMGLSISVCEDLRVLAEYDRLVGLEMHMRETADKLAQVTHKIRKTALYNRLRAAEEKRNGKET